MRLCLRVLTTAGLLLVATGAGDDTGAKEEAKSDAERIRGIWKVVSTEDSGRKAPDEAIEKLELVITKDTITYKFGDQKTTNLSYKLDSTRTPKWIDLVEGENAKAAPGIYELDGDKLKICFPEGGKGVRSTAFESKPDSVNDVLIVLKRRKP